MKRQDIKNLILEEIQTLKEELDEVKLTPTLAFKIHKFLSNQLGDKFTNEYPTESYFYFDLKKNI